MTPAVYVGDRTVLLRTQRGTKMFVDSTDTVVSPHLILDGEWESWVTSYLERRIAPESLFIDVGAHCGWYTLLACQLVGPRGRVIAVEPNPRLARLLRRSLSINGFEHALVLQAAAVGPEAHGTKLPLVVPAERSGNGHLRRPSDPEPTDEEAAIEVLGVCLDEFLRGLELPRPSMGAAVIKIDAERYEADVVRGCWRLVEGPLPPELVIEHHDEDASLFRALWGVGYSSSVLAHDGSMINVPNAEALSMLPDSEMISCRK